MISPKDLTDAIEAALLLRFPGEDVYRDLTPEDFSRPANLIECAGFTMAQAGSASVLATVSMKITTFCAVDSYHFTDYDVLYRRAMLVAGCFARGWLPVADPDTGATRAPHVTACQTGEVGRDYAEVVVGLQLELSKTDFDAAPIWPLMEHLDIKMSTE